MESEEDVNEIKVSEPLQHLLSLDWESLPDVSTKAFDVEENVKPLKPIKKVRFSDEVKQSYLDSFDAEHNDEEINNENYPIILSDEDFQYSEDGDEANNSALHCVNKNIRHSFDSSESDLYDHDYENLNSETQISLENQYEYNKETVNNINQFSLNNSQSNHTEGNTVTEIRRNSRELYLDNDRNITTCDEINCEKQTLEKIALLQIDDNPNAFQESNNFLIEDNEAEVDVENDIQETSENFETNINKNVYIQRQTVKINTLLNKANYKFSSVPQMKSAVIKVWSSVKEKDLKDVKKNDTFKSSKIQISSRKTLNKDAHFLKKKFKLKKRKNEINKKTITSSPKSSKEKSRADEEENEIAFKLWKKQKDRLKQQESEIRLREEQDKNIAILMNKEIKKEDAESAYLSWLTHKAEVSQKERTKKRWYLQKDKEVEELKIKRDKDALEIYNLWLETKYYKKRRKSTFIQNRPPWIPQG